MKEAELTAAVSFDMILIQDFDFRYEIIYGC